MAAISQSFRCFDAVARQGSIRKAAAALHLTAPAVNQQILNLEEAVGARLFDRLPNGMQLTVPGEILLASVRRSQRDWDNAIAQMEDLKLLRKGHVSVGASDSSAADLLPDVISDILSTHPGLTFNVRSGTGETLLKWLANGEVDIVFCLRRDTPPGVEEVRAWPHWLGVVTPNGHPLLSLGRPIRMRDCLDYPLILMAQGMELRSAADRLELRQQRRSRPVVETSSTHMARRLVARGDGIAFLMADNVWQDAGESRLVWTALADPGARLQVCIYQRTGYTTPVAVGTFLQRLEQFDSDIRERFEPAAQLVAAVGEQAR